MRTAEGGQQSSRDDCDGDHILYSQSQEVGPSIIHPL